MDMLVKLYELPPLQPLLDRQTAQGIRIVRAMAADQTLVVDWVAEQFGRLWQSETAVAFSRQPITCFIAIEGQTLAGFACHDVTSKGFFGPTGVAESHRGRGIGRALLLASLHDLKNMGYAYAIIGGVGPADFYAKTVGAIPIPDSTPGIFQDLIQPLT